MYIVRDRLIGRPYKQYTRLVKGRDNQPIDTVYPMTQHKNNRQTKRSNVTNTDRDELYLQWMEEGKLIIGTYGDVYSTISNRFIGFVNSDGNRTISLKFKNQIKPISVHRLMWLFYHGRIPKGLVVSHIDGNKLNNTIENLKIDTVSNSLKHTWKLGLHNDNNRGTSVYSAKLNEKDVRQIRKLYNTGKYSYKELGTRFNVGKFTIANVINYKTWKHVA